MGWSLAFFANFKVSSFCLTSSGSIFSSSKALLHVMLGKIVFIEIFCILSRSLLFFRVRLPAHTWHDLSKIPLFYWIYISFITFGSVTKLKTCLSSWYILHGSVMPPLWGGILFKCKCRGYLHVNCFLVWLLWQNKLFTTLILPKKMIFHDFSTLTVTSLTQWNNKFFLALPDN